MSWSARSPRRSGPARPGGHGQPWEQLEACRDQIRAWVRQDLTVVKIGVLLERQGVAVPYRTLHRFCAERCGYGRSAATTVRVADGEPGMECQLDFGYLVCTAAQDDDVGAGLRH